MRERGLGVMGSWQRIRDRHAPTCCIHDLSRSAHARLAPDDARERSQPAWRRCTDARRGRSRRDPRTRDDACPGIRADAVGGRVPPPGMRSTWSSLGDCELLRLVVAGHVPALTAILDRHRSAAVVVAARICGAPLAEEAVQEAFLQVSRASGTYRPELGPVRNWLLGIVRHRAIDALRVDGTARPPARRR